jgi:hypothetical protein
MKKASSVTVELIMASDEFNMTLRDGRSGSLSLPSEAAESHRQELTRNAWMISLRAIANANPNPAVGSSRRADGLFRPPL